MLTIWGPCECGEEPKELHHTSDGAFSHVSFTCSKCGKLFADIYRVEYMGRFNIEKQNGKVNQKLRIIKTGC